MANLVHIADAGNYALDLNGADELPTTDATATTSAAKAYLAVEIDPVYRC